MNQVLPETVDRSQSAKAGHRRLAPLWAVVVGAVALHNAEEWLLGMTGWIAGQAWLPGHSLHGDQTRFALVLAIVTVVVLGIAVAAIVFRPRWSAEALVCIAYALVINGVSHLLLSLLSWSVMPGVISGVAVLLPIGAFVIRALPPVPWTFTSISTTVIAVVGITLGAFVLASLLTGIG